MTSTRPTSPIGSRTSAAHVPARPNGRPATLREADSGIQVAIQQVHDDVHEHEEDRYRENAALHERVIALHDRGEEHSADTRDGEDLLDDDRATEQLADLDTEKRDDREEPVLQELAADDQRPCEARRGR